MLGSAVGVKSGERGEEAGQRFSLKYQVASMLMTSKVREQMVCSAETEAINIKDEHEVSVLMPQGDFIPLWHDEWRQSWKVAEVQTVWAMEDTRLMCLSKSLTAELHNSLVTVYETLEKHNRAAHQELSSGCKLITEILLLV